MSTIAEIRLRRVESVALWAKGWSPQVLGVVASILAAVWGAYGNEIWTRGRPLFVGMVVAFGCATVAQVALQRPTYPELHRRLERAEYDARNAHAALADSLEILLSHLARHCAVAQHADRSSVYYLSKGRLHLIARSASDPQRRGSGRHSQAIDAGVVGQAWTAEDGFALQEFPSKASAWRDRVQRQGYSAREAESMSMRSRRIAALRCESGGVSVGVVVFESLVPLHITQATVDAARRSPMFTALAELVKSCAATTLAGHASVPPPAAGESTRPWRATPRALAR